MGKIPRRGVPKEISTFYHFLDDILKGQKEETCLNESLLLLSVTLHLD